jgi:hypothetical protein
MINTKILVHMEDPIKNLSIVSKIGLVILAVLIVISCILGIEIVMG